MEKMRTFLLFSVVLLFVVALPDARCQNPRVMAKPSRYYQPGKNELKNYNAFIKSELREGTSWMVYSDRDNNPTYTEAQGGIEKARISFLENFWVIGESGTYLHLAKDSEYQRVGDYLTDNWEDYGWIHKNRLLLWENCLYTNTKIAKKAMVLNTAQSLKELEPGSGDIVNFFRNPDLTNITDNQSNLYNIFFVFKEEGSSVLLAKVPRIMDRKNPTNDIWGWVTLNRLFIWDHRIAVEPNWDEDAVKERRDRSVKTYTFSDEVAALNYKTKHLVSNNTEFSDDPYDKRRKGTYMRFPLKTNADGLLKMQMIGEISTMGGQKLSIDDNTEAQWRYGQVRYKRRNINIVFVVDATFSMRDYFKPIANAITETVGKMSSQNNFKFGGVVYRDLPEGMDNITESFKLSNNYESFSKWLNSRFSEKKNLKDKDLGEAVNYGLREALRTLSMPKDETNIVILVGDAGNHARMDASTVSGEEIVNLMIEKSASFLAFQINNGGQTEYDNFVKEAKNIMLLTARELARSAESTAKAINFGDLEPKFEQIDDVWRLNNSVNIGRVVFRKGNTKMEPNRLQFEVADFVQYISDWNDNLLAKVNKSVMDGRSLRKELNALSEEDKYVSTYGPSIVYFLKQLNLSSEVISKLAEERVQFAKTSYSAAKLDDFKYPHFQSVLFLTREELGDLLGDISKLLSVGNGNDARRKTADMWLELLKQHMGDKGIEGLANASMQDISKKVFGLPSKSKFISTISYRQITDEVSFPSSQFEQWLIEIDKKYSHLRNIYNSDNYEYSFRSNDTPFYWISENNLP